MPLGIVTDEEFEAELAKCQPIRLPRPASEVKSNSEPNFSENHGRHPGDTNVPPVLRRLIGEAAIESRTSATQVAQLLGISPSSASAYANGSHSTASYHEPDPALAAAVDAARQKVIDRSRSTLHRALDYITAAKLEEAPVRDISGVAKDMAVIIAQQEPKLILANQTSVQAKFVFHVPESRPETAFEVLDVHSASVDGDPDPAA